MTSKDRVSAQSHACPKCVKSHPTERLAAACCETGDAAKKESAQGGPYGCGKCATGWADFSGAAKCCKAYYVTCPTSDLPEDAYIGQGLAYNYGKSFTGNWELFCSDARHDLPTRVYPLPPLVAKMVDHVYQDRFEEGRESAQKQMRDALGIPRDSGHART